MRAIRSFTLPISILSLIATLIGCGGSSSSTQSGTGTSTTSTPSNPTTIPLAITLQPASVSVQERSTAQFSVQAVGSSPIAYQWQKNGVAITGATQPTYSLANAQLPDNGTQFSVSVSDISGKLISSPVSMTVQPAKFSISIQNPTVSPLGGFLITGANFRPTSSSGLQPVQEQFSIEYTLGPGAVATVPTVVESDGSIHGIAPPGIISGGQITSGLVSVRVKRVVLTSPTAATQIDFTNSVSLSVGSFPMLPTSPGYATRLLILVGKYLVSDGVSHSSKLIDASTASRILNFDFDNLANNVISSTTPSMLGQLDSLAAATLLTVYHYDLTKGVFTPRFAGGLQSPAEIQFRSEFATRGASDPTLENLGHSIADSARSIGTAMADAGKVLGVCTVIAGLVVESPLLLPAAGVGALMGYVGTSTGTALGFAFDMAATAAENSSDPQPAYKTALTTINYFAANQLSNVIEATVSPIDDLFNEYLESKLSPTAYSIYETAGAFMTAESGPISEKIIDYAESVATSDPKTSSLDKATIGAAVESGSSRAVANALDSVYSATLPSNGTYSSLDDEAISVANQLLSLSYALQDLADLPGNPYQAQIDTYGSCAVSFAGDISQVANQIVASGGNLSNQAIDAFTKQLLDAVKGMLGCGAVLTTSLKQQSNQVSNTQTGRTGTDQVSVTASSCTSAGCWITETTTHSDGSTAKETGYVACERSGFCPLYLH